MLNKNCKLTYLYLLFISVTHDAVALQVAEIVIG